MPNKLGGGDGEDYSNPGEVVIWKRCPKNFDFYIMDDDVSAGVMQMPDGTGLYLSTAAKAGQNGAKDFMKSQLNIWGIRIHKIIFNDLQSHLPFSKLLVSIL